MGESHKKRCKWCGSDPLLLSYHDQEWGVFKPDDESQFEHLVLETFQPGLNWLTILKKRNAFRENFKDFDPEKVAKLTKRDINKMLKDERIIRSKAKIEAAINNAQKFIEIVDEFGSFFNFLRAYIPQEKEIYLLDDAIPNKTIESEYLAADLKKRGFKFIGPINSYAHLQSVGIVNDHISDCFRFEAIERMNYWIPRPHSI